MQGVIEQPVDQRAAVAVHDRLGHAGGAGGIDHPDRVIERQLLERHGRVALDHRGPGTGTRQCRAVIQVRQQHQVLQGGQVVAQAGDHIQAVEILAAVAVAVHRDHHLRIDLLKAVEHAAGAHVRRTAGPDRADAGAGQERHHRFRNIGQVGHHPVAGAHAQAAQAGGGGGDLPVQLAPGEGLAASQLGAGFNGRAARVADMKAEHLLGEIQAGTLEPFGAGHGVAVQHPGIGLRMANIEVFPERRVEALQLVHRPVPELRVIAETQPFLGLQPAHVVGQAAVGHAVGVRRPERRRRVVVAVHGLSRAGARRGPTQPPNRHRRCFDCHYVDTNRLQTSQGAAARKAPKRYSRRPPLG